MKKSEPLISIIVPIYNVEQYLEDCIKSIINQTYSNLEILLINDGSTDGSMKIIDSFVNDLRIVVIDKENTGQSECRYIGYEQATGEFLYFIDSDDILENNAVEVLYNTIVKHSADFVCCRFRLFNENNQIIKESAPFKQREFVSNDMILNDALILDQIKSTLWTKMFRKSFLKNNQIKPEKRVTLHDDCMFTFLSSIYAERVGFTNDILYNALQRNDSISRVCKPKMVTIYDIIYKILKKELVKTSKFDLFKANFYRGYSKGVLYALVLACIRTRSFNKYRKIWSAINKDGIYYAKEFRYNLKQYNKKMYILILLSYNPFLFYIASIFLRYKFKH